MSRRLDDEAGDEMMRKKKLVDGKPWLLNRAIVRMYSPDNNHQTHSGVDMFGVEGFRKRSHGALLSCTRVGKHLRLPRAA